MYAVFYDTDFNVVDEIEIGTIHSYDKKSIEHKEGRLTNISSLFVICEESQKNIITINELISFYGELVSEELKKQNDMRIERGFHSPSLDAYFGYSSKDQKNMNKQLTLLSMNLSAELIEWNTFDNGVIVLNHEQFKELCVEAGNHERSYTDNYWRIKDKVMNCTSLECLQQIDDIETAEDILDSYQ